MVDDNVDSAVVEDFGNEWKTMDQASLGQAEKEMIFRSYFSIFPWSLIGDDAVGYDAGCGSGRWAMLVAPKVKHLHCVDPSVAIDVAKSNLKGLENCSFHKCTVGEMPFPDESMDFGYSLGVLHHIPDTQKGIESCVKKLKKGAPFLLYLYYAFDNKPLWYAYIWKTSDYVRRAISRMPKRQKLLICQMIAYLVYFPLARAAKLLERKGFNVSSWPLSAYRDKSFYTMKTDALDRFGTRLEHRFTRLQIREMMIAAGLQDIEFSSQEPYHCAIGYKK